MEREENGIITLFNKLQEKVNRFEKQIKLHPTKGLVTPDFTMLFNISDSIDKLRLMLRHKRMDQEKVVRLYTYLISKDPELVSLAKVILDNE